MNGDPVITPPPIVTPEQAQNASIALLLARTGVALMAFVAIAFAAGLAVQIAYSNPHTPDPTLMSSFMFIVGVITGAWNQLFNSAFGSTTASKAKDSTINTLVDASKGTGNGTSDKPQNVTVVNKPSDPVPVETRP